ncbi:MAG: 16S rRNA (uracil(1498)-N(3))-methyltransferase [Pseudomonadota bacterium]
MIRLFIKDQLAPGADIALGASTAHYLKNVMRQKPGDVFLAFNGENGEFAATIKALAKKAGVARLGEQRRGPEPVPDISLLIAPVKRAALETIIQKSVELGAKEIAFVKTDRIAAPEPNYQRLDAIAMEATEQCGRLSPPAIKPMAPLEEALDRIGATHAVIFCDEAGDDLNEPWGGREGRAEPMLDALERAGSSAKSAALLIGPEGGFSPDERLRLQGHEGVIPVTLGPRILRADTAVITALALWQAALGDLASR